MRIVGVLLLLYCCLPREGASQECVNGLMTAERVRQLGRVAGARTNDRNNQQRIVPEISFSCSGRVTKWIMAGQYYVLFRPDRFPEMQIWRETANSSGVYTKISGITQSVTVQFSQIYEYTIDPVDVQSGDVLGIFQPANSRLELYYTDQYGPVNYYMNTGSAVAPPTGDFGISGADGRMNDMPLVTVEITPTDGSSASDCVRNFASMDAIEIGIQQVTFGSFVAVVNDEEQQQRIIPAINFTCHGFITKWILAAKWNNTDNLPELQTWNSTDGITYTQQGATTFSLEGGSAEMTYYEYSPNPPNEFNDGDVLGIFIPDQTRLAIFFERVDTSPLNYVYDTGNNNFSPPGGDLIATSRDTEVNAAPLIAVEVSATVVESESMSSAATKQPPDTATMIVATTATSASSGAATSMSASVDTPTPVTEPTDKSSSSSGSSDQLSVGVFAGVAVGAVIAVILGVVFIAVIVLWRRRTKEYALSAPEVQENQAYGTVISTGPTLKENPAYGTAVSTGSALEKNPTYGAFEMTGHGSGQQPELREYEMIVNQEYGASTVELMATTTIDEIDPEYSYPRVDTDWPLPFTDRAPDQD